METIGKENRQPKMDTVKSFHMVDDVKMKPIYKKISSLGLITIFHAGYDYGYAPPYHCMPDNLLNALRTLVYKDF